MRRFFVCLWLLFFALPSAASAAQEACLKETQSRPLLGAIVRVDVCYVDGQQDVLRVAMARVWERLEQINVRMNFYNPSSDVALINAAQGKPVRVHDDVAALLKRSKYFKDMTRGVFDVTVAPLSRLWKQAGKSGNMPAENEISQTRRLVNADRISVGALGVVSLEVPGMQVDLGGNAQGYAADEVSAILKANGFRNFLVDMSGEIFAAGLNCEGKSWRIGVKDPGKQDRLVDVFALKDAATSTSGGYEKYIEIQGQRWSHIINPVTGYPQKGVVSATVIAPTAIEADVLSTTLCVLGPAQGLSLIRSLGTGYEALVFSEGREGKSFDRFATPGYEDKRITGSF